MWTTEMLRVFLDDLWTRFRGHVSNASAHHAPYTDAEVDAIVAVHTAIDDAHHAKYTDVEAVSAMGVKSDTNPLHHDKVVPDAAHVYSCLNLKQIANTTIALIDWDNDNPPFQDAIVEYDYGNMYEDAASERLTCKKTGLYFVTGRVYWHANANGQYRCLYIYKNGGFLTGSITNPPTTSFYQDVNLPIKLAVNDYIDIRVYQDSGGYLTLEVGYVYEGLWLTMLREV